MRIFQGLIALTILLAANAAMFAQSDSQKVTEVEGVTEYRLSNNTRVLLIPDAASNSITVNMTVMVGSRHEGYGETGMAHLLEHMLFKGTPKHGDIDKELKEKGVLDMNGTTWYDRTNYYETLPASDENMDWAIAMEADRLVNCFVKGEDLASEMTVVRSEFERNETSPISILNQRLMANAYEWHNYGKSVIGNKADIERVPIYNLKRFYKKYYRPDNVIVIVAGKIDSEKALASCVKHFGSLENPPGEVEKTYTSEPTQDGERIVYLSRSGDLPVVGVGYHVPAVAHEDYAAVEILDWILGDEPSGKLYNDLVKTKKASMVFTRTESGHDPGMLLCYGQVETDADVDTFRKELVTSIERVITEGVTAAEVARAIASISKEKEEDPTDSAEFSMTLSNWSAYGDWRLYYLHRDRIAKVTPEDVKRVAERYLKSSNRTVGIFLPTKEASRATVPSTPRINDLVKDYKGRESVSEGEIFEPTPENIAARVQRGVLPSGIKYTLLPKKTRGDRFYMQLSLRFGSEATLNDPKILTACSMLGQMLSKGTTNLDRQQLEDKTTELKCDIGAAGGVGVLNVTIQGRQKNLAATLDLMNDILRNPAFPVQELELMKAETVSGIESQMSNPQMKAINAMTRKMTPVDSSDIRYDTTPEEAIERAKAVTIDDIKNVYTRFLSGSHGELTVVGAIDSDVVIEKVGATLNGWTSEEPYQRVVGKFFDVAGETITIETPDKANAIMVMATNLQVKSDDADWEAMYVANDILGGGSLSSRLGERIREQEGLSYAVGSQFRAEAMDRTGGFLTFAITNPANRDKLLKTVDEVFDDYLAKGITDKELADTKTSYSKSIEDMLASEQQLMGVLHRYQRLDRDESFIRKRLDQMQSLTKEEVNSAAAKLINGKKFVIVTAGDFANAKAEDKVDDKK